MVDKAFLELAGGEFKEYNWSIAWLQTDLLQYPLEKYEGSIPVICLYPRVAVFNRLWPAGLFGGIGQHKSWG